MAAEIIKLCNYHNLDDYRLSEVNQTRKYHIMPFLGKIKKRDTKEHMYNTVTQNSNTIRRFQEKVTVK